MWIRVITKLMSRKPALLLLAASLLVLSGCVTEKTAVPLPAPPPEAPVCNLPAPLHQRNWLGDLRQGSCAHASLVNHLRWLNDFELAEKWRSTYGDGEYASRIMQRLDKADVSYTYTLKADPRFLDWCSQNRTGCILWWKPSHCCTFMGWVTGADGQQKAAILDNNYPGRFEYTPREQFIRLWAGYGGFGLSVNNPPTTSIPYLSYEVL